MTLRVFWLTLFGIGAAGLLVFGWQDGVPFTAAAFVAFFVSRVWRSVIKRPRELPALFQTALDARAARATLVRGRSLLGPAFTLPVAAQEA